MSLQINNLQVKYYTGDAIIAAVDGISLDVPLEKHAIGIVGESGSGKTTLGMSIMNVVEKPGVITGGSINYDGTDVLKLSKTDLRKYRWEKVSMVYQSAMNSLNPVKSVRDPIIEVLREHDRRMPKEQAVQNAVKLLGEVGIKRERTKDYPHEFSGGMRQRVVIALALALSPKLLIADEPTSALDVVTQRQILSLLKRKVDSSGLSLLFITHEISVLSGLVDEIVVMFEGQIVERGPIEKIFQEPLHPYTEALLANLLTIDSDTTVSSYETPSSAAGNGQLLLRKKVLEENLCKYSSRCKYAFDRCVKESPVLQEAEKGRWVACHKYA
jgi:peptide/nickel transport system ATP-binding protein